MPVVSEWQHANPAQRQAGSGRQQPSQSGQKADAVGRAQEVARTALIWCAALPQSEWRRPVLVVCVAAALHRRQKKAREKASMPCSPRGNREIKHPRTRLLTGRQQIENFLEGPRAPGWLGSVRSGNLRLSTLSTVSLIATAKIASLAGAGKNDVPPALGSAKIEQSSII